MVSAYVDNAGVSSCSAPVSAPGADAPVALGAHRVMFRAVWAPVHRRITLGALPHAAPTQMTVFTLVGQAPQATDLITGPTRRAVGGIIGLRAASALHVPGGHLYAESMRSSVTPIPGSPCLEIYSTPLIGP